MLKTKMEKKSTTAVIMCIYAMDTIEYLELAIDSIIEQTYKCDLFIYRDGFVSQELSDLLNYYVDYENVHIYESSINRGLAFGLNYLIDIVLSLGYCFIARMDSDDISINNRIEEQVNYLNKWKEIDVLGSYCEEFGSEIALDIKKVPLEHDNLLKYSISRCPFIHPTVIFRAEVFKKGFRYPINTSLTEDMALWFELLNNGFTFANLDKILLKYRLTSNTIARRKGFKKSISEINIRIHNMIKLKQISLKNIFFILFRLFFHVLPNPVIIYLYKNFRNVK